MNVHESLCTWVILSILKRYIRKNNRSGDPNISSLISFVSGTSDERYVIHIRASRTNESWHSCIESWHILVKAMRDIPESKSHRSRQSRRYMLSSDERHISRYRIFSSHENERPAQPYESFKNIQGPTPPNFLWILLLHNWYKTFPPDYWVHSSRGSQQLKKFEK